VRLRSSFPPFVMMVSLLLRRTTVKRDSFVVVDGVVGVGGVVVGVTVVGVGEEEDDERWIGFFGGIGGKRCEG